MARNAIIVRGQYARTVKNDRKVKVQTVVCPTCRADVSVACISSTGKPTNHGSRRRMALRAEYALMA